MRKLEWLGLFSSDAVPAGINTALDVLCCLSEQKLVYLPGEKDMIVMRHEVQIKIIKRTCCVWSETTLILERSE